VGPKVKKTKTFEHQKHGFFLLGCEVVVSGKLRGQRAKSMKFVDGLMIHSGDPCNDYVDTATRHVLLRQGVLGIKVRDLGCRKWV
jgi:ribosomal protein S3